MYGIGAGCDANLYYTNICYELHNIQIPEILKVRCDNKAGIDWSKGVGSMKGSRHFSIKLYRIRHLIKARRSFLKHVKGFINPADKLTKTTVGEGFT